MSRDPLNKIFAALVFLISLVIYGLTMAPTVSFWDCGEFIACSYRLAVPHPPGAPLYLLVSRIFTLMPSFLVEDIARRVNWVSVLSSAFTVLFLYLSIVYLVRQYLKSTDGFLHFVPYLGAMIGALIFAFSHSFWFNAVEAEVYAPSMFFTSIVVWLVFRWHEKSGEKGNEKYILLIAYLIGLALGVHLLNVLALPMIFLVIYFKKFKLTPNSFLLFALIGPGLLLIVYPAMVHYIPWLINKIGFTGFLVLLLTMVASLFAAIRGQQQAVAMLLTAILLITIGYSSYLTIYIRSGLDPNIDENDPETIERFISYMNREQYGQHHYDREKRWKESPNGNRYESASQFFWEYQIDKMYVRYFLWNFGGMSENKKDFDIDQFWFIPLLLGLFGIIYHFYRDWQHGLAVFLLFFMTGLAIVLYLNQPDPQPRERDYSYVGSFFAFAIWIGIGAAAALEFIAKATQKVSPALSQVSGWLIALLLLVGGPGRMLAVNYDSHDRSGNYVAWDYSYNMLASCEPGSVLFTAGDNDTFPVWYLQEVEGVRTDVRIANLSLLNTPWYIKQLRDLSPKVPIHLKDKDIDELNMVMWPDKKTFEVPFFQEDGWQAEQSRYRVYLENETVNLPPKMAFNVSPTTRVPGRSGEPVGVLRIQDIMVLNILAKNQFQQPLYFSFTCGPKNQLDGLQDYLRTDGIAMRITPFKNWKIETDRTYDLLMNKFRYRNLDNPDVYYEQSTMNLVQNYRMAFYRLALELAKNGEKERFSKLLDKLFSVMPPEVIPFNNLTLEKMFDGLAIMTGYYTNEELTSGKYSLADLRVMGEIGHQVGYWEFSLKTLLHVLNVIETDPSHPQLQNQIRLAYRSVSDFQKASEEEKTAVMNKVVKEPIRKMVLDIYEKQQDYQKATRLLEKWLIDEPGNQLLQRKLAEILQKQ